MKQIIDISQTFWIGQEGKKMPVSTMTSDHILRAMAWCKNRKDSVLAVAEKIPATLKEKSLTHNDKSYDEWINLFSFVLFDREAEQLAARKAAIKAHLQELESIEEKRARLEKELAALEEA